VSREGVGLSSDGINLRCPHTQVGAEVDSHSPVVIHPFTQPVLINNSLHDVHCHIAQSPLFLDVLNKWPYENVDG
jgi:hypothetical protein